MDREISKIVMTKNSYHTAGSVNQILNEEKIHEIIPFLKELTIEERKTLVPSIKKMDREISKIVMTKNSYHTAGSVNQ
ncbi:DUF6493 family protein, partial [Chryseobacterium sp. CH1]|uniref:DUF6493 family protein n=1 Tax=Chryseobacterium sp. CH1 TaxID=713551 RepID=UPI001E5869FD